MKLRIKGSTLRLRVSRSDAAYLIRTGRIEETIRFAPEDGAKLTYAVEHSSATREMRVQYCPQKVIVALPTEDVRKWHESEQVGLYRDIDIGDERLTVMVEKDFACLDGSDADNVDVFENPNHGTAC